MSLALYASRIRSSDLLDVRAIGTIALHRDFRQDESQPFKEWQFLRAPCAKYPGDALIVTHDGTHKRPPNTLATMGGVDNDHRQVAIGKIVANGASEAYDLSTFNCDYRSLRS
jgi:hypothetical protein